jgi:hypothetical protein
MPKSRAIKGIDEDLKLNKSSGTWPKPSAPKKPDWLRAPDSGTKIRCFLATVAYLLFQKLTNGVQYFARKRFFRYCAREPWIRHYFEESVGLDRQVLAEGG